MGRFDNVPKDVIWIIITHVIHDNHRTTRSENIIEILSWKGPNHFDGMTGRVLRCFALVCRKFHRAIKTHCFKHLGGWLLDPNAFNYSNSMASMASSSSLSSSLIS